MQLRTVFDAKTPESETVALLACAADEDASTLVVTFFTAPSTTATPGMSSSTL